MKIDLNEIEALARAATPGPWEATRQTDDECSFMGYFIEAGDKTISDDGTAPGHADALFIAAANPAAVLELIALARQAAGADTVAIPLVSGEALLARTARQGGGDLPPLPPYPTPGRFTNWWTMAEEKVILAYARDAIATQPVQQPAPVACERVAFEAWCKPLWNIDTFPDGTYENDGAYAAWKAWNARAALAAPVAAPVATPTASQGSMVIGFPDPEAVFAQFCEREGYPSDGGMDEALRKAFYEGSKLGYPAASVQPTETWLSAVEGWVMKLNEWRLCMSYNSSYFGEPQGLVKRCTEEMEHLFRNRKQQPSSVRDVALQLPEMESLADIPYAKNTPDEWDEDYRSIWQQLQVAKRNLTKWAMFGKSYRALAAHPANVAQAGELSDAQRRAAATSNVLKTASCGPNLRAILAAAKKCGA